METLSGWQLEMSKAKTRLMLKQPFFATLVLFLDIIEDESIKTMGTDGKRLYVAPSFVLRLAAETNGIKKLMFVLCHEVMHCIFYHMKRMNQREMVKWNIATDLAINQILVDNCENSNEGFVKPDGILYDPTYKDLTAEQIYAKLPESGKGGKGKDGKDGKGGKPGDGSSRNGGSHEKWKVDADTVKNITEWKQHLSQAATMAKMRGVLPSGMDRYIDNILYPKIDWKDALRNFIQPRAVDYDWTVRDRRFPNIAMPDLCGECVEDIVVAIDTSGSIDNRILQNFLGEIRGIVEAYGTFEGHVCCCDAAVHTWQDLTEESVGKIKIAGGGGTSFVPVFQEISKRGLEPAALIYLTDGYGDFPKMAPEYPVMWVMTTDVVAPFGATVEILLDNSD